MSSDTVDWAGLGFTLPPSRMRPLDTAVPRATLILEGVEAGLSVDLWMGGADSGLGEPIQRSTLSAACLIDCAGEAPAWLREAAAVWVPRVFADLEAIPDRYEALLELAADLALLLRGGLPASSRLHLREGVQIRHLYVLCQQGMNRSALLTGLVLRAAGMRGEAVVELLRQRRPGCLTNLTFQRLLGG